MVKVERKLNPTFTKYNEKNVTDSLKSDLDISSSYSTFKRWIIRDNKALNNEFKQYTGD